MVSERPSRSRPVAAGIKALLAVALTLGLVVLAGAAMAVVRHCERGKTCWGTEDNDKLVGTRSPDEIAGWAGDDLLEGRTGNDVLFGGKGADNIHGNGGEDKLYGGRGYDDLFGGAGDDELHGKGWLNALQGGPGDDLLVGGRNHTLFVFDPSWGSDVIRDEPHLRNRVELSEISDDLLIRLASKGRRDEIKVQGRQWVVNWTDDTIGSVFAGTGNDRIVGHPKRNVIVPGLGVDEVQARNGDDTIDVFDDQPTADTVDCGRGDDRVTFDKGVDILVNCERKQGY